MLARILPAEEFAQELLPLDRRTSEDNNDLHNADIDSEDEEPHQPGSELAKPKPTTTQRINESFAWEILMMVLSAGILVALVVVLAWRDNEPQPDWQYMSLNSLISWMTTISRAGILFSASEALGQLKWVWFMQQDQAINDLRTFDEASRGPLGAVELIWKLRGRYVCFLSECRVSQLMHLGLAILLSSVASRLSWPWALTPFPRISFGIIKGVSMIRARERLLATRLGTMRTVAHSKWMVRAASVVV
jgi:hypothetical protein